MKGKFTSVILAVVLVAITAGTIFFGYSKASGKITKSGAEEEQRYAWPLATCSTEDTITHIFATQFAKEVEKLSDGMMPEKQSIIQISRKKFRKFIKVQAMIYLESQTSVFV